MKLDFKKGQDHEIDQSGLIQDKIRARHNKTLLDSLKSGKKANH